MRLLADFHHNSLLRSFVLLFENRLGIEVYRPIGMEWFENGFWAINDQIDTAKQFLEIDYSISPDNTPLLNTVNSSNSFIYTINDPGNLSTHKAITLDAFRYMEFDYLIASIPAHIPLFEKLIEMYQPKAKLIVHMGNNWDRSIADGRNVLASVKDQGWNNTNAVYYHQEFDTNIFKPEFNPPSKKVSSYINILQNMKSGWSDFCFLEKNLEGVEMKSYGGQCRDGGISGAQALAESINSNDLVFHVKDGGDGYGHVLYNSYACGKPVITRSSFYNNQLGQELFSDGSFIDLDRTTIEEAAHKVKSLCSNKEELYEMSITAYQSFRNKVDFAYDAEKVRNWLENL
jgi:glycosyltransferase involved in cell wall biosynthesis